MPKKLATKNHITWRKQKCIKEKLRQGLKRRMLSATSIKGGLCGCPDALWTHKLQLDFNDVSGSFHGCKLPKMFAAHGWA